MFIMVHCCKYPSISTPLLFFFFKDIPCLRIYSGGKKPVTHNRIFWYENHIKHPLAITNRDEVAQWREGDLGRYTGGTAEVLEPGHCFPLEMLVFTVESKADFLATP